MAIDLPRPCVTGHGCCCSLNLLPRVWLRDLVVGLGDDSNHQEEVEHQLLQPRAELGEAWSDGAAA
jgi:hypothetical protein